MTELDSRARALLDQYNAAQAPGPEVSERVLAAVQARAVAGDLGPEIPTETAASTTPAPTPASAWPLGAKLGLGGALIGTALAVTVALVAGRGGGDAETDAHDDPARAPIASVATGADEPGVDAPARTTASTDDDDTREARSAAPPEATADTRPSTGLEAAPKSTSATKKRPPRSESAGADASPDTNAAASGDAGETPSTAVVPATGPDLGPEVALMTEARAAMRAGERTKALRLLDRHAREFPRGVFASERELSRVTTLCAMGESEAAAEVARRHVQRHPAARDRLARTCAAPGI